MSADDPAAPSAGVAKASTLGSGPAPRTARTKTRTTAEPTPGTAADAGATTQNTPDAGPTTEATPDTGTDTESTPDTGTAAGATLDTGTAAGDSTEAGLAAEGTPEAGPAAIVSGRAEGAAPATSDTRAYAPGSADGADADHAGADDPLSVGFLIGLLAGEGHFGGDGRQPHVTLRMHIRHEATFRWLERSFPGGRLYGPYTHGGRSYFQWMARGGYLREHLAPLIHEHRHLLDNYVAARFDTMCRRYSIDPGALASAPAGASAPQSR